MKVFAENVGFSSYLTAGKVYDCHHLRGDLYRIVCDDGDQTDILLSGCAHLSGGCWIVVDRSEDL